MTVINQNSILKSLEHALVPSPHLIDGRTEEDHLCNLVEFASLLNFYNKKNLKQGDWQPFLLKDPIFLVATIAKTSFKKVYSLFITTCTQLEEVVSDTQVQDFITNSCNQLFDQIIAIFQLIEQWTYYMLRTDVVYNLKTYVLDHVKETYSALLWAVLKFREALNLHSKNIPGIQPVAIFLYENYDEKIWKASKGKMPYWTILNLPLSTNEESKESYFDITSITQQDLITALYSAGKQIFSFFNTCISYASVELKNLNKIKGNFPDTILLRTFTNLLQIYKQQVNKLSDKHLSFYYNDILKQSQLPEKADSVFISCSLVKKTKTYTLPKGTLFNAGVTVDKSPVLFETTKDVFLNTASIKEGYTLNKKVCSDSKSLLYLNQIPLAGSLSKNKEGHIQKWKTFGSQINPEGSAVAMGMSFSSPMLYLTKAGKRILTILITFTKNLDSIDKSIFENDTTFYLSTSKDWFEVAYDKKVKISYPGTQKIQLKITLETTDPSIEIFKKNPDGYTSTWPVFKMLFSKYKNLENPLKICQLVIKNEVTALQNVSLYNDFGALTTKKPFQPFGPTPNIGQNFIIGSAEVFSKPTDQLKLTINWKSFPKDFDFSIYYKEYNNYLNNKYSENQEEIYENQKKLTQILSEETNLFAEIFNSESLLFQKLITNINPFILIEDISASLNTIHKISGYLIAVLKEEDTLNLVKNITIALLQIYFQKLIKESKLLISDLKKVEEDKKLTKLLITLIETSLANVFKEYWYLFQVLNEMVKKEEFEKLLIALIQISLTNFIEENKYLFKNLHTTYTDKEFEKLLLGLVKKSLSNLLNEDKVLLKSQLKIKITLQLEKLLIGLLQISLDYLTVQIEELSKISGFKEDTSYLENVQDFITAYQTLLSKGDISETSLIASIKKIETLIQEGIVLLNEGKIEIEKNQLYLKAVIEENQAYLKKTIKTGNTTLSNIIEAQNTLLNNITEIQNKAVNSLGDYKMISTSRDEIFQDISDVENGVLKEILATQEELLNDLIDDKKSFIEKLIAPITNIFTSNENEEDYVYAYFSDTAFKIGFESLTNGIWSSFGTNNSEKKESSQVLFKTKNTLISSSRVFNFLCSDSEKCSLTEVNPYLQNEIFQFTETSTSGFIKMQLTGPQKYGFGLDLYPKVVAAIALFNGKLIADKIEGPLISPPNPPFTPIISSLTSDYSASVTYDFSGENNYPIECFYYTPFENYQIYDADKGITTSQLSLGTTIDGAHNLPIFPRFTAQGELLLALENITVSSKLNLYFELTEANTTISSSAKTFRYNCLTANGWERLTVISDTTNNFTCSGIITLNIPSNITTKNTLFSGVNSWISIGVDTLKEDTSVNDSILDNIPQTIFYKTNGFSVQRIIASKKEKNLTPEIKASTITSTHLPIPEITNIVQPFSSFGGKAPETKAQKNQRISTRLHTKDRLINPQDYFNTIQLKFPEIFYSKSLYDKLYKTTKIYAVKSISDVTKANAFIPLINKCEQLSIQKYITDKVSPFTKVKVLSFGINYIKIKADITIRNSYDKVDTANKINNGINIFLAPWIVSDQEQRTIGDTISTAQIATFIKTFEEVVSVNTITLSLGERNSRTGEIYYSLEGEQSLSAKRRSDLLVPSLNNLTANTEINYHL